MLEVLSINKYFGGLQVLRDVSFEVKEGEFWGLIGPNGSGKTTLFNILSGVLRPSSGKFKLEGQDLTGCSPDSICRMGILRTFQIPRPFKSLSIIENVMASMVFGRGSGTWSQQKIEIIQEKALQFLKLVNLEEKARAMPAELGLPGLRRLEIARALAATPKLLLLDEILSGLNQEELKEAALILQKIRDEMGITIIWVEHIMSVLMTIVEKVLVLNNGTIIAQGTPSDISSNDRVIEAYLGK